MPISSAKSDITIAFYILPRIFDVFEHGAMRTTSRPFAKVTTFRRFARRILKILTDAVNRQVALTYRTMRSIPKT
jgi:hypothetical protein